MPFVPVPNTLQVEAIYLLDGQRVENTLYFEHPGGWDLPSITAWMEQLRLLIEEDLLPLLSSTIQFIELVGRLLDTASSIGYSIAISPPGTGGASGELMPNNVTYTVSFKTGLTGRSFRGRNYIPGLSINSVDGNNIASAFRTGVLAFYDALLALATSEGLGWVVVSRYSGVDADKKPIPRVTGVTTPIVAATTFDNTVDSQRRRLPGRGR